MSNFSLNASYLNVRFVSPNTWAPVFGYNNYSFNDYDVIFFPKGAFLGLLNIFSISIDVFLSFKGTIISVSPVVAIDISGSSAYSDLYSEIAFTFDSKLDRNFLKLNKMNTVKKYRALFNTWGNPINVTNAGKRH